MTFRWLLRAIACLALLCATSSTTRAQGLSDRFGVKPVLDTGESTRSVLEEPLPVPRVVTVSDGRSKQLTVRIQELPTNPFHRIYTVLGTQAIDSSLSILKRPLRAAEPGYVSLSIKLKRLATALLKMPGVTQLTIDGQTVSIDLGQAFDWSVVETQILETLLQTLLSTEAPGRYVPSQGLKLVNDSPGHIAVNREISTAKIKLLRSSLGEGYQLQALSEIGPTGRKIVLELFRTPVIDSVIIEPYELSIALKDGQIWTDELNRQVKETIRANIK